MYSNTTALASARVRNRASWTRSVLSEAKKLSMGALSRQLPRRLMDDWMPCRSSTARYGPEAYWADSSGRRNGWAEGGCDGGWAAFGAGPAGLAEVGRAASRGAAGASAVVLGG